MPLNSDTCLRYQQVRKPHALSKASLRYDYTKADVTAYYTRSLNTSLSPSPAKLAANNFWTVTLALCELTIN